MVVGIGLTLYECYCTIKRDSGDFVAKNPIQAMVVVTTLGVQFAISLLFGYYLGSYLDQKFQTGQLFMAIGVFLGIGTGVVGAIKLVKPFLSD